MTHLSFIRPFEHRPAVLLHLPALVHRSPTGASQPLCRRWQPFIRLTLPPIFSSALAPNRAKSSGQISDGLSHRAALRGFFS